MWIPPIFALKSACLLMNLLNGYLSRFSSPAGRYLDRDTVQKINFYKSDFNNNDS